MGEQEENFRVNVDDWKYLTEGLANVIFEYLGKLLRLKKVPYIRSDFIQDHYYCMGFLFGSDFFPPYKRVRVEKKIQIEFSEMLKKEKRRKTNKLDVDHEEGEIVQNLHSFDVFKNRIPFKRGKRDQYSFELKPKWGVKNLDRVELCRYKVLKKKHCRFCMQQEKKLESGKISRKSEFCPLMLFCGDTELSLKKLREVPQHFLFLFQNGRRCKSWDIGSESKIMSIILKKCGILEKIQRVQLLNTVDIEVISRQFEKIKVEAVYEGIREWVRGVDLPGKKKFVCGVSEQQCDSGILLSETVEVFRRFLLSKSARDCSIIGTFYEIGGDCAERMKFSENEGIVNVNGMVLYYHVELLDLDEKKLQKVPYWKGMDGEICACFMKSLEGD